MKTFRILVVVCIVLFHHTLVSAQANAGAASVTISGDVTKPLALTADDLAKMKHQTVMVKSKDGKEHPYSGVAVQDLFQMAGVTTKGKQGKNLTKYMLVKCADGYQVLFSLAEIDSSFTDKQVVLADTFEGKPLVEGKGPFQLAVPGEKKPARSCYQVREIIIKSAEE